MLLVAACTALLPHLSSPLRTYNLKRGGSFYFKTVELPLIAFNFQRLPHTGFSAHYKFLNTAPFRLVFALHAMSPDVPLRLLLNLYRHVLLFLCLLNLKSVATALALLSVYLFNLARRQCSVSLLNLNRRAFIETGLQCTEQFMLTSPKSTSNSEVVEKHTSKKTPCNIGHLALLELVFTDSTTWGLQDPPPKSAQISKWHVCPQGKCRPNGMEDSWNRISEQQ